jgi:hypothetical protein
MEKKRNTFNNLDGNPQGKRPVGRRGRKWKDMITMDIREIWCEVVD